MKLKPSALLMITSFVPVIAFKVIARAGAATLSQARIAALVGVVLAMAQCILSTRLLRQTTYLERAFLAFLAVAVVWVSIMPMEIAMLFVTHSTTLLYIVLFLTTLLPQAFGYDPFTYAIARQRYPETVWNMPQFRTINLHITYVWSGLFLAAACSSFLGGGTPVFSILVPLVFVLGVGLPFSTKYPHYYLKHAFPTKPIAASLFPDTAIDSHGQDRGTNDNRAERLPYQEISGTKGEKKIMKIVAIQGSPRPKASNTEKLLQEFLKGTRSEGADAETIYLKEKNIHHCVGCYTCWTKTPGVCVFKDDMPELLEKVRAADLLVYATPLYIFNVTALMKIFQDRMLPLADPHLIKDGETYRHPRRHSWSPKMVLVSTCGFPEISHFDGLRQVFRHVEKSGHVPLVGELLVPGAELVLRQEFIRERAAYIFQAAFQAGVEVVRNGVVSKETEARVQQLVVSPEEVAGMANIWWDSHDQGITSAAAQDVTKVEDMRLLLRGMAMTFNASAAPDLRATIQFDVTGKQPGEWFLSIQDGACTYNEGHASSPALTIKTPSEVWTAIASKQKDGQEALMAGEYKVEGDFSLLMRLNSLFGTQV
ncbi:MAG TPA: NAD(P)H-dependent oxidoreductase [Syntrophorhabdales bacterium]|nr:NAD(P)H-dependent oxidoreductase [Syntrophorhabdales bacterium]